MKRRPKWWQCLGFALAGLVALAFCVRTWAVPALIVSQARAHYQGGVTIRDWWFDGKSAGVVGLTLHEGAGADSVAWATFERVSTDLSLGGMIRGRFMPGRIALSSPRITLRLDPKGRPMTRIPVGGEGQSSGPAPTLPSIAVKDAQVTIRQEDRPEMVLSGVDAQMVADPSGTSRLSARMDGPTWGRWEARGEFTPGLRSGQICLVGRDVEATPEKESRIPFVPVEVWENVAATGPLEVRMTVRLAMGTAQPVAVRTEIALRHAAVTLPAFGLDATGATGAVVVEDGVVKLDRVAGRAIGGDVAADGALDFSQLPPRFDLALRLNRVHVADAPKAWQLDRMGLSGGLMSGKAQLRISLAPDGVDLTGTTGDAEIQGATLQGFPVKSLRLVMHAEGGDLLYEAESGSRAAGDDADVHRVVYGPSTAGKPSQPPPKPERSSPPVRLPKSFSTEIDLEDVELSTLVARAALLRIKLPADLSGRFSIKARATIPLGALRDLKAYAIHGRATLAGASVAGVDLGRASARFDLDDGILELTDFHGLLVDLPDGGGERRPAPATPIAPDQPLPGGGFRGSLHAELSPPGRLSAHFEGDQLPLGELAAPVLPRPTPVSGLVSVDVRAEAAVDALTDPKAWKATGSLEGARITHRTARLDALTARFRLDGGTLAIPELSAHLAGRPLDARLTADLSAPYAYEGKINVGDWSLDDLLGLIPGVPQPAPVGGTFSIRADARGTLAPWTVETRGEGHLSRFRAGPVPMGDLPFRWTSEPGEIAIDRIEARPFGGRLVAHARVPRGPGRSAEARIDLVGIDMARLSAALPGRDLTMTGQADVRVSISAPTERKPDVAALESDVSLSSPDLTVEGVPAREGHASLSIREGVLTYDVRADALDARIRLRGDVSLAAALSGREPSHAQLQAGWFSLEDILKARGVNGPVADLKGTGAVSARVGLPRDPAGRWVHALGELRGLRWGNVPVGNLKANAVLTPTLWQVKPLSGDLLGSPIHGDFWRETGGPGPPRMGGNVRVERIELAKLGAFLPGRAHDHDFSGYASVRLEGHLERATAEIRVDQARIFEIPMAELHVPAEVGFEAISGAGTLQIRQSTARLAGGLIRGDALYHFGSHRGCRADFALSNIDLKAFKWLSTNDRRPATGKISGRIKVDDLDPARVERMRGKVHLDLTDASLFELPVFRQIGQFLGSEHGGIFEAGELDLTVAGGKLKLDKLALVGRLLQLRARGTIGFHGALELEVLVKPNRVLPQTGRAVAWSMLGKGSQSRGDDAKVLETSSPLSDGPVKLRISGNLEDPKVIADPSMPYVD